MGADGAFVRGSVLAFTAGSDLDVADRALRQAAHRYHCAKTPEARARAAQELRRCAVEFTAVAQSYLPKVSE